jgi:hypothetical protein
VISASFDGSEERITIEGWPGSPARRLNCVDMHALEQHHLVARNELLV